MSLKGGGVEGERTLPFPAAEAPPAQPGPPTPPIWAPPPPATPSSPGGSYPWSYPGSYPGSYSGGPWRPPGVPQPKPPRRSGAAFLVVVIVRAVVVLVVALSYAVVGGLPHRPVATSTRPSPAPPAGFAPSAAASPSAPVVVPPVAPSPSAAAPSPQAAASPPRALTAAAIAAAVDPSVVDVNSILGFQGGTAAGTGMVLTSTGAILTNNHVIDGATRISVQIAGTGRTYAATVVGKDVAEDVAVVQPPGAARVKVPPLP